MFRRKILKYLLTLIVLLSIFASGCNSETKLPSEETTIVETTNTIVEEETSPIETFPNIPDEEFIENQGVVKEEIIEPTKPRPTTPPSIPNETTPSTTPSSPNSNTDETIPPSQETVPPKECLHSQLQFVPSDNPPTCDQSGYYLKQCPDCLIQIKLYYDALGHSYEYFNSPINVKASTCSIVGYEGDLAKCKNCNHILKGKTIPKNNNHESMKIVENTYKESTCIQSGKQSDWKCSDCGYIKYGESIEKLNHVPSVATCIEASICKNCNTQCGNIDKNNHIGQQEIRGAIEQIALCCSGYTGDTYCSACNIKIKSGQTIRPTLAHTWSTKYLSNPYAVQNTCARCQSVETTTLSPLDIVYVGEVDSKLYFEPINNYTGTGHGYTKLTYEYSYISDNGYKISASNTSGAGYVPKPAKNTIITVTISEYTNNVNQKSAFRKVTKYFDTSTNTWQ